MLLLIKSCPTTWPPTAISHPQDPAPRRERLTTFINHRAQRRPFACMLQTLCVLISIDHLKCLETNLWPHSIMPPPFILSNSSAHGRTARVKKLLRLPPITIYYGLALRSPVINLLEKKCSCLFSKCVLCLCSLAQDQTNLKLTSLVPVVQSISVIVLLRIKRKLVQMENIVFVN